MQLKTAAFVVAAVVVSGLFAAPTLCGQCFACADAPPGTIFCDDFEDSLSLDKKYFEYDSDGGDFVPIDGVGRDASRGMRVRWQKGQVAAGSLKKSFGRIEGNYLQKNGVFPNADFDEIYWRMDVALQKGWQGGGPAKLSRALTIANSSWATGAMAHLWSGGKNNLFLGMDPASGIGVDGMLKTTKYNDFDNLRWLGFKAGTTDIYSSENSGKWHCIEGHVKLNNPELSDGVFEFWIDDTLQAGSYALNWHGAWNRQSSAYKLNAIFFENYWNSGSPVEQERYFDNIVVSTERIGCKCAAATAAEDYAKAPFSISPNPTNDILLVSGLSPQAHNHIVVVDMFGQTALRIAVQGISAALDISLLPTGIYIAQIGNTSLRFVKQ